MFYLDSLEWMYLVQLVNEMQSWRWQFQPHNLRSKDHAIHENEILTYLRTQLPYGDLPSPWILCPRITFNLLVAQGNATTILDCFVEGCRRSLASY